MEGRRSTSLMLLLLYALLILALLILVVSGARLYTNALEMKELHSGDNEWNHAVPEGTGDGV